MNRPTGSEAAPAAESAIPERRIGLFTTDTELVVKSWDAALELMTGVGADSARGRPLRDLIPDLDARGITDLLREGLVAGGAQVLAPALHKFLIPCAPLAPSAEFDRMQQRVAIGALLDDERVVGLVVTVEDVTARLERERALARQLRAADPAARLAAIEQLSRVDPVEGLGPLADAMSDEHWQVRRAAVHALAARRDASLVDAVVRALRDGHRNFNLLSSALQLLSMTGVDVTAALAGLVKDPDPDLRVHAALALGTQRGAQATLALLTALDDADPNVCFHVIEALGRVGAGAATERLVAIAESRNFFLAFPALDALVRIGNPSVAPRLAPLLTDPMLAAQAADALGHVGDEDAVPALVAALGAGSPAVAIVSAIARIHQRYTDQFGQAAAIEDLVRGTVTPAAVERVLEALPRASGDDLSNLVVVVGWLSGAAIQRALAHLLGRSGVQHAVIEAFVRFGAPAVDLLTGELGRGEPESTRSAIVALGRIGDRRAVAPLIALLTEDHREQWVAVATALSRMGDGRAFEPLLTLLGDPDSSVRQAAIGALNSIGHPGMGSRVRALLEDSNPHVRESAVRIAGYFGYASCADRILACCHDDDETVRAAALDHVPFFDDPRVLDTLETAFETDTSRVRAAVAHALASLDAADARPLLHRAIADPDPWVRYFAVRTLGRHGDSSTLPALEALATSDPAPHVRVAAVESVGAIGGDDAVRILEPIVAAGEDDLSHAAVRALGNTKSSAIGSPLRAALRSSDPRCRAAAAEALASWHSGDAAELLRETAAADADPGVMRAAFSSLTSLTKQTSPVGRQAVQALAAAIAEPSRGTEAVHALARIPASAIPWLAEELRAGDLDVRLGTVEALDRLSHPVASAYLQRALDDGEAAVRRRAVGALARLGTRGLGRRFAQMARTDPSAAVRDAAAAALARQEISEGAGAE
jgi:HEAT repeat protein